MTPHDAEPVKRSISVLSPTGMSLIGLIVGAIAKAVGRQR